MLKEFKMSSLKDKIEEEEEVKLVKKEVKPKVVASKIKNKKKK
jgi:hypothetical protein